MLTFLFIGEMLETEKEAASLPNYDVFFTANVSVAGTTRPVLIPFPNNPITADSEEAAVQQAASLIVDAYGSDAEGDYIVYPPGSGKTVTVIRFDKVAVLGNG